MQPMSKRETSIWQPMDSVPLDGRPVVLHWGGGLLMVGEWTTALGPRGCWQGVLVDPGAERALDEAGDPEDAQPVRYALTVGGGDLVGWMPLPQ